MIYLIHENNEVVEVLDNEFNPMAFDFERSMVRTLYKLANQFPDELLIWCQTDYKQSINKEVLHKIFHHEAIMASFSVSDSNYLPEQIGYIDHQIYIKINKKDTFPTWLMSIDIGGLSAKLLMTVFKDVKLHQEFDYYINSLAKIAMPQGLFCYSEPLLFINDIARKPKKQASLYKLFQFVKQHYKLGWLFFLFFCLIIYERKFPIFQLFNSLRFRKLYLDLDFSKIKISSSRKLVKKNNVDVIIPTIGRKKYLFDVLNDLSNQTVLPKNVIIVEQNPDPKSNSELDFITAGKWPFRIRHEFIHRTGVCHARNLAIGLVESEWTFFGDDDIRFNHQLIEDVLKRIENYGVKAINTICLQPGEKQTYFKTSQTPIFGSGTSFVKSELLSKVGFDMKFEYGYGEDSDFGMQIRNIGEDVVFISDVLITHLKAPTGGYRIERKNKWDDEIYLPKPSPTIMLFNQKYLTKHQMLGYKLLLFIKFYKHQSIKNPFRYISQMKKQWNSSLYWSKQLGSIENA